MLVLVGLTVTYVVELLAAVIFPATLGLAYVTTLSPYVIAPRLDPAFTTLPLLAALYNVIVGVALFIVQLALHVLANLYPALALHV